MYQYFALIFVLGGHLYLSAAVNFLIFSNLRYFRKHITKIADLDPGVLAGSDSNSCLAKYIIRNFSLSSAEQFVS